MALPELQPAADVSHTWESGWHSLFLKTLCRRLSFTGPDTKTNYYPQLNVALVDSQVRVKMVILRLGSRSVRILAGGKRTSTSMRECMPCIGQHPHELSDRWKKN